MQQLQQAAEAARIATAEEAKTVLTEILRDPEAKHRDRIRAGETLLKSAGEMGAAAPGADEDQQSGDDEEKDQVRTIIQLPWNGQAPANAVQNSTGKIFPLAGAENATLWIYVPAERMGGAVFYPYNDDEQSWLENQELLAELKKTQEIIEKESERKNNDV